MIVCSCNMLRDSEIAQAAASRPLRVTQVHACLGCRPRCGGCFATIKQTLKVRSNNRFAAELSRLQ